MGQQLNTCRQMTVFTSLYLVMSQKKLFKYYTRGLIMISLKTKYGYNSISIQASEN